MLDGSIPAIKLSTYRRRLNSGSEVESFLEFNQTFFCMKKDYLYSDQLVLIDERQVTQDDKNLDKMSSLRRNMGSEFSCMIKEAKALGLSLGVPCLEG